MIDLKLSAIILWTDLCTMLYKSEGFEESFTSRLAKPKAAPAEEI